MGDHLFNTAQVLPDSPYVRALTFSISIETVNRL